jgi:hypothetical protein
VQQQPALLRSCGANSRPSAANRLNLRSDLRGVRSTDINGVVHVVLVVSDSNISQSHVSAVGPQTGEAEEDGATAGLVK